MDNLAAINILTTPPSRDELIAVFSQCPPQSVLPRFGSEQWKQIFQKPLATRLGEAVTQRAAEEAQMPLPELSDELYGEFSRSGDRLRFETLYFRRRCMLSRAGIALLRAGAPANEALLQSFLNKLEGILAEESWSLPAHVTPASGRDPLHIDLFTAETTNTVAESLWIFADLIPAALQEKIRRRLAATFANYLGRDYWWLHTTNNWNAVCNQGMLGAALCTQSDPALLADMVLRAIGSLPNFLSGFGADGACSEGPSYWDYGFGWFTVLNEQLEARTGGRLSLFEGNSHIRAIADYGHSVSLADGTPVNFSDAGPQRLRPSFQQYLGQRLGNAGCLRLAAQNYAYLLPDPINLDRARMDQFYFTRLFLYEPKLPATATATATATVAPTAAGATAAKTATTAAAQQSPAADSDYGIFFPSLGVWIARGRDQRGNLWEVAAKGGNNAEHHNHNDVGNFIVVVNSVRLITEIGMPEYNGQYFSPRRYEFAAARSLGHSLPLINGCEQRDGEDAHGDVLLAQTEGDTPEFRAELSTAYPAQAGCEHYERTVRLDKRQGRCECTDRFRLSAPAPIEGGYISHADTVTIVSDTLARIESSGVALLLRSRDNGRWLRVDTLDYNDHAGKLTHCKRLILVPAAQSAVSQWEAVVTMELEA